MKTYPFVGYMPGNKADAMPCECLQSIFNPLAMLVLILKTGTKRKYLYCYFFIFQMDKHLSAFDESIKFIHAFHEGFTPGTGYGFVFRCFYNTVA